MHTPKKFRQENVEELIALVQSCPFASLVVNSDEGVDAMHLPMVLKQCESKLFLQGHIAKANSVWKKLISGSQVLAIFNGPNCYISPNHYPTKMIDSKAVPTWNYVVVHCKGLVSFKHDPDWLYVHISELTDAHESGANKPWAVSDAPADYIEKMLSAIVGVEIEVNSIVGKWKLSQNQVPENQKGVVTGLSESDDPMAKQIAALVAAQSK